MAQRLNFDSTPNGKLNLSYTLVLQYAKFLKKNILLCLLNVFRVYKTYIHKKNTS